MALLPRDSATYYDISVEVTGFIYVLLLDQTGVFVLDIYTKQGTHLATTSDVRASKFAIDLFRDVYTVNFDNIRTGGAVEPSVSLWIPNA